MEIQTSSDPQESGVEASWSGGGESDSAVQTPRTPHTKLIEGDEDPEGAIAPIDQGPPPPAQPLNQLVESYLMRLANQERSQSQHIADVVLAGVCRGPITGQECHADALDALERARQYLQRLAMPQEDIDVLLRNAKAKAQVSTAPSTASADLLNSVAASSCMYLVTFFLGKWLTATTGIGLVFTGPAGSAALSALVNALVVPLTQAIAGDPMGAALRNFGPSVASEDSRQYGAFMTAHALYMRAHISGAHPALKPQFALEMDRAINAVVWREQGMPGTVTGRPIWFVSGVDPTIDPAQPKAVVDDALRRAPYTAAQRRRVIASMLGRILVSDELPVHTFTLLNGVTGILSTLWPRLYGIGSTGQAISRAVDAALHTSAGFFAMYFMFLLQDWIRPIVQGVGPMDPTDDAYLEDKITPLRIELTQEVSRLDAALAVQEALQRLKLRLKKCLKAKDLPDGKARESLEDLLRQCTQLCKDCDNLERDVDEHKARLQEDIRALTTTSGAVSRLLLDTWRVVSGRSSRAAGPSWTDGSPSVVRGVSKYLGYVSALVPVTLMSIATSRAIGASYQATQAMVANAVNASHGRLSPSAIPAQYKAEVVRSPIRPDEVVLTENQLRAALTPHIAASGTTALVAILGWNTRNVLFDPLYQHAIHAAIGVVERAVVACRPAVPTLDASAHPTQTMAIPPTVVGGDGLSAVVLPREPMAPSQRAPDEEGGQSEPEEPLADLLDTARALRAITSGGLGDGDAGGDLEAALQTITPPSEVKDLPVHSTVSVDRV